MIFIIFWFALKKIVWFERGFEYLTSLSKPFKIHAS